MSCTHSQLVYHFLTWKLVDVHISKQGNTTDLNTSFFHGKLKQSCSGGTRTHDILLARQMLALTLSYRGNSMVGLNQENTR